MWFLVLLHLSEILNVFDQLKYTLPNELQTYCGENYVHGSLRRKFRN